jgi:hypothetical protein
LIFGAGEPVSRPGGAGATAFIDLFRWKRSIADNDEAHGNFANTSS